VPLTKTVFPYLGGAVFCFWLMFLAGYFWLKQKALTTALLSPD
jgi:hypothetical protein